MPPFHGERMSRYGEVMREITLREMERWPVGAPLAIHGPMQSITLDVILRTVFGVDEGAELDALRAAIVDLTNGFNAFNMVQALRRDLGPRSPWGAFVRRRDAVDALLYQVIRARRAEGDTGRDDVMTLLTSARYEDGTAMGDRALRDELMTLLAAGHETTATALPWTLHELAQRPEVQARVHDELDAGGHAYLDAVIKETMRLHPVISAIGRVLQRPHSVAGWDLPAGTLVSPSIYLAHRDPVAWPDPERFDATRFLDARISPYAYLPFGGGARRCIGMAFALYEMRIVLATMLARFRVAPAPGVHIRPRRRGVSMAPSDGMPIVVTRR
jgi:cytochrome P450